MTKEDPFRSPVSNFNRDFLISDTPISRIGQGELGGKAQGLVFIRDVLNTEFNASDFPEINIGIPSLLVICTGAFDVFMERNNLYEPALTNIPDGRIAHAFQSADLPFEVLGDLRALIDQVHTPLAIRSSSLLEDARHEPFAGIYATKMIPNNQYDADTRFQKLVQAIKFVYASTFFKAAKNYRRATGHRDEDEKMAVIVQEVVGKRYSYLFYPELSGVARSYNYYPVKPARPENGVVNLALGLGKIIVDSGISWPYSPAYPKVEPPFGSVENLLENTQNEFWAVNMGEPSEYDPTKETEYLLLENFMAAEKDNALRYLASTYDLQSGRLFIGTPFKGPRALTFAPILILQEIPLNDLMISLLAICQEALGQPVEIEFAMTFNPHRFGFLQVRTMVAPEEHVQISDAEFSREDVLVACESVLGNGVVDTIRDIVYIKPERFSLRDTREIVPELAEYNQKLLESQRTYLLVALGRLGTTDPWLGVPIDWSNVSGAKVILEVSQQNVKVELSQGTHYFHNLINLGVKYFSLPFSSQYTVDWNWLSEQSVVEESQFIRHVRLPQPLRVKVDGRSSRGVILKC
jgi:hypothetical protein